MDIPVITRYFGVLRNTKTSARALGDLKMQHKYDGYL